MHRKRCGEEVTPQPGSASGALPPVATHSAVQGPVASASIGPCEKCSFSGPPDLRNGTLHSDMIAVVWAHGTVEATALTLPLAQEDPGDCCFAQGGPAF